MSGNISIEKAIDILYRHTVNPELTTKVIHLDKQACAEHQNTESFDECFLIFTFGIFESDEITTVERADLILFKANGVWDIMVFDEIPATRHQPYEIVEICLRINERSPIMAMNKYVEKQMFSALSETMVYINQNLD